MKTKSGTTKLSKIPTAASSSAAVLALVVASLISIPGLGQNFLFHLLGASEPIANFTTTSSTLSESVGSAGLWPASLSGWTARRAIVVEGVNSPVSNFALLLKLDSTRINYANTLSQGADLRFSDAGGNLLDYEIESWDPLGVSYVWVKIPTLAAQPGRSVLWMYYGNSMATAAPNASGVWSAQHSKVLHLNGAIGSLANGTALSASVGANATANNAGGTGMAFATGAIGNGVLLDGTDDWISAGADSSLNFAASAPFTVSAYVKTTDAQGPLIAFRDAASGANVLGLYIGFNGASSASGRMNILMRDSSNGTYVIIQGPVVNDGIWHHVAVTRNAGNLIELLVDGVSYGTASSAATGGAFTTDLRGIGVDRYWVNSALNTVDQQYLAATVDEVRVSGVQQPTDYFLAQKLAVEDSIAYFQSEETPSQGTSPITVALNTAATSTVTIPYVLSGTSTPGLDHNRVSGSLVIASGASSGSLNLQVLKDQVVEPSETAILTLGTATGATLGNDSVHTVTITDEVLVPPDAVDDPFTVTSLAAMTIPVLANDTDANGDFLMIVDVTAPLRGTAVKVGRTIRYTPNEDFSGTDSFTYTISDGRGGTDTATVNLNFQIPFTWTGLGANTNWSTGGNWQGGVAPGAGNTAYFNNQCSANCDPLLPASVNVGGLRLNSSYTGTIAQSGTVVTIGTAGFRQRGGTFTGGSANFTATNIFAVLGGSYQATAAELRLTQGDFSVVAPGVFNANGGTLRLACVYGLTCNITPGSGTYNHVVIGGFYSWYELGGNTMVIAGDLSMGDSFGGGYTGQPVNNGTFALSGNYNVINTGVRGSAVIRMVGNSLGQQVNGASGLFLPRLTIAAGANQVTLNGEVNVASYYTYESGTVVTTGSTLWVHCDYGLTCPFVSGPVSYNNLRLSSYYGHYDLGGGTVTVGGSLTIGDTFGSGYLNQQLNNGTFNVTGNISISPFGYRGNAVLNSVGGNSSISAGAIVGVPQGTVTVNKTAKTNVVTFGSNLSFSGTGQAVNVTTGTVDLAGFNLGVGGVLTVGANGKISCNGGTLTAGSVVVIGEVDCGSSVGITWTGLGGDQLWTNPLNWTDETVPGPGDIALFNSICGANCNVNINANISVRGFRLLSSYTGTITKNAGASVSVAAGGWLQDSGTFAGSNSNITVTSTFTQTGGVFTAPTATFAIGQEECTGSKLIFSITGGTFNHGSGRLKFQQGRTVGSCQGHYSIAVPAGFTVYDLEFTSLIGSGGWTSAANRAGGMTDPIKVLRNFYDYGPIQNLNFDVEGDVYLENTNGVGAGVLKLVGTTDQKIITTGVQPSQLMRIAKSSGQVLPEVGVTNIWLYGLDLVQGSFTAPTGTLILGVGSWSTVSMNSLSIASGTTFATNGGTVRFGLYRLGSSNATANIVVPAGFEFNHVEVTASAESGGWYSFITSATTVVVAGNLQFGGNRNNANWHVRGNVSLTGTAANGGTGSIRLNGSSNQTLSGVSTARSSAIVIASTGGTVTLSGTIVIPTSLTHTSGIVDPGTSTVVFSPDYSGTTTISPGTMSFNNVTFEGYVATINITGTVDVLGSTVIAGTSTSPALDMFGGTVLARGNVALNSIGAANGSTLVKLGGSTNQTVTSAATAFVPALAVDSGGGVVTLSGTINILRGYEHLNGTVDAGTSTLVFGANSTTAAIVPGSTLFNNVTFGGYVATYNISGTLSTVGTLTIASASGSPAQVLNTGTLNPQGALVYSSNGATGTSPITFTGLTASSYSIGTSAQRMSGLVTVDKSGGAAVNLASNVSLITGGQDLLLNQGILNLSGFDLTVNDSLTLAAGTTLRCSGGEFASASLANSGSIECPGYSTYPFNWTGNAADGNFATAGNWQGGVAPTSTSVVVFNSAYCGANCNSAIPVSTTVRGVQLDAGYLGTLTQNLGAALTVGAKGWRQSGGTFVGGDQTILIEGVTYITGGTFTSTSGVLHTRRAVSRTATFNHNGGKWRLGAPYLGTVAVGFGNLDVNDLEFYSQSGYDSFTMNLTGNVNILGDLNFTSIGGTPIGALNGGALVVRGDITTGSRVTGNVAVQAAGTTSQTITGSVSGSSIPNLTINSTGGTVTVVGTPTFYRSFTHSNGAVDFGTSTVTLLGQYMVAYALNLPLLNFNNLTFESACGSDVLSFNITGDLNVMGNLQLVAGCAGASISTGTIVVHGNVSTSGSSTWTGTAGLSLRGASNSTITQVGAASFGRGNMTIMKTGATVTQTTAISLPIAGQSFTVTSGTYNMAGFGLTVAGTLTNNSVLSRGTSPACGTVTAGTYVGTAAICPPP